MQGTARQAASPQSLQNVFSESFSMHMTDKNKNSVQTDQAFTMLDQTAFYNEMIVLCTNSIPSL